ncbi:MAG: hypothetical protein GX444_02580 [Myxococcales bacterium]|nr:hypothetical protein [Myxococcales bacterium]
MKLFLRLLMVLLISLLSLTACGGGDDDDDNDAGDDDAGDDDAGDDDAADDDAADDDAGDDDSGDDDDDDNDADDWSDFFPPPAGPLGTYRIYINEEETEFSDIPVEVVGEDSTTFPGETYSLLQAGDFDASATNGQRTWFDLYTVLQAGIRRSEVYEDLKAPDPTFSITFDPAILIEFDQAVGETRTNDTTGTWDFGDGVTVESDFSAAATVQDDNASIDVPFGTVTGCRKVALAVTETGDDGIPFTTDSTFYVHPDYGIIRIEMVPGFFSIDLVALP